LKFARGGRFKVAARSAFRQFRPTMQFRGGMNELMRQASRMQRKIDERKAQLKDEEVSASAASDKVKVVVTCEGKLRAITIDPDFLKEDVELAMDSVVAAANAALEEADKKVEGELNKITGGLKIPGM
jgi:nucleoid-associated protein EbfC